MNVAFDCDGTLIRHQDDTPRYDIIKLFHILEALGCTMYIWSGGGVDYAERWRDKLGLTATVVAKGSFKPEIAIDDEYVTLGLVNLNVDGAGSGWKKN